MEVATKRRLIALMLTHRNAKDVPSAPHKLPKVAAKEARKAKTVEKEANQEKPAKVAKTHLARVAAKRVRPERAVEKVRPTMTQLVRAGLEALISHRFRARVMPGPIIARKNTMVARLTTASLEDKVCPVGHLNIVKTMRRRSSPTVLRNKDLLLLKERPVETKAKAKARVKEKERKDPKELHLPPAENLRLRVHLLKTNRETHKNHPGSRGKRSEQRPRPSRRLRPSRDLHRLTGRPSRTAKT